jgi:hypothetical protein
MGPPFDPYYNWLGIPAAEQPPNHYRLLGLAPFESNPTVIEHAADRVMIHLRTFAAGPHGVDSQRLLNEVATARVCLLDAAKKARYDADLRSRLAPAVEPVSASGGARLPRAAALPVAQPAEQAPASVLVDAPVIAVNRSAPNSLDAAGRAPRKAAARKPNEVTNPQAAAIINIVKVVMGGLGGLSMAILLVWVVWGVDALGLFGKKDDPVVAKNPAQPQPKPGDPEVPGDPTPPSPTPGPTPRSVAPSTNPTDPANPFQPVPDPTDPANPPSTSSPSTSLPSTTPPSTKPRVKPKPKQHAPSNPAPTPVETPVESPAPTPMPVTPTIAAAPTDSRHALPSEEAQKAKFDEFKSLYSKEFEEAERAPARDRFPEFLISKADSIKSDPVARFAILRQAYTRLINARDFGLAVEIVDRLEQEYKVDELAMRVHTLTKASTAGRQTVAERQSLALCAADLAEAALRRQRIDHALTLARMAENLSKALQNKTFRERTITLKEEVEKAQASWGPVERARQTLAASPDDAAAALVDGRYRCLVAGDWATGLPVLAKGGSDPLAAAARLDQAGASDSKSAAAIADAWYDLAKSDDKLKPLYARALHWYRRAVANSTGADQVPWLQRVEQIEGLALPERYFAAVQDPGVSEPLKSFVSMYFRNVAFEPIDCFKFVVPLELKASPWNVLNTSPTSIYSKADIVYGKVPTHVPNIPREYQVGVRVSQYYSSTGPFIIGMVGPRGPFAVVVDMPISTEFCTFITLEGAKTPEQNPTLVRYARQHLMFGDAPVLVQLRRNSVTVQIKNQEVTKFDGDLDKLVSPPEWTIPKFNGLLLGAHQGSYRVSSWFLEPVAPAPRLTPTGGLPAVPNLPNFPSSP